MSPNLILFLCACVLCVYGKNVPIVSTEFGKVSGIYDLSYKGRQYSAFYGIPYAQPPIGQLRFKEPQPLKSWPGIWRANLTVSCIQIAHAPEPEGGAFLGDEDCLYLNVFVPRMSPAQGDSLDVIVHIHGGAFMFGSGIEYAGPKFLMDRDVILVTFNYRLGIFGFLSTEDDVLPGNIGMKDQSAALKWIKDNIKYFGGNPESITLTGLSAGGASVHYHYLSPLSKGLFTRGISVSGNVLAPWTLQEKPLQKARFVASHLGCDQDTTKKLIKCMKERPARQIVEVTRLFRPWLYNPFSPLSLVIEKAGKNPFLAEHPYVLLTKGKIYDVPWMTSITSEEGLYPAADFAVKNHFLDDLSSRWTELAPYLLDYNYTLPEQKQVQASLKIRRKYIKEDIISKKTYKQLIHMMGDRLFSIPTEQAAKIHSHVSKWPVYFYYFTFMGDKLDSFSVYFALKDQNDGVCHGDDVMYIFSNPNKPENKLSEIDEKMQKILLDMWISYAKMGKPNLPGVEWIPVTKNLKEPLEQLQIKSPSEMVMERADSIERHREMWKGINLRENENLFPDLKREEL